jgi:hypothetical protein
MKKIIIIILVIFTFIECKESEKVIKILTVEKTTLIQNENNPSLVDACNSWCLSKEEVLMLFTHSKQINLYEKNNYYYSLPCEISGTLLLNDSLFSYSINAGGTATLIHNDCVYYYGCSDSTCGKLVLMPPDIVFEKE